MRTFDLYCKMEWQRQQRKVRNRLHYLKLKADPEMYARRKEAMKLAQQKFQSRRKLLQSGNHQMVDFEVQMHDQRTQQELAGRKSSTSGE
ncbi:hypothetical protein ACOMHN_022968 [Nucella lapillus]